MKIEIDKHSGFCFGVQKAISKAEQLLSDGTNLNSLGEIVHNHEEVDRLSKLGMTTISSEKSETLQNAVVLIRTHGEAPLTYNNLKKNNNQIVDATCPVVLKLQNRIKQSFDTISKENGQLVIFGKKGHAEVVGLNGQTENRAIIVSSIADLEQIDFNRPIELFCQTTMPLDAFNTISDEIKHRAKSTKVIIHDTICRQVANRVPHLKEFSAKHDIILFVSGKNSSNGKLLYEVCKNVNPSAYFISTPEETDKNWFANKESIGICGATSTPQWLMENVKTHVKAILNITEN